MIQHFERRRRYELFQRGAHEGARADLRESAVPGEDDSLQILLPIKHIRRDLLHAGGEEDASYACVEEEALGNHLQSFTQPHSSKGFAVSERFGRDIAGRCRQRACAGVYCRADKEAQVSGQDSPRNYRKTCPILVVDDAAPGERDVLDASSQCSGRAGIECSLRDRNVYRICTQVGCVQPVPAKHCLIWLHWVLRLLVRDLRPYNQDN